MKRILITGGTGFLGENLGNFLTKFRQYDILLVGRNNKINQDIHNKYNIKVAPMDIVSIEQVKDVFNFFNPNIVIHAAATKYVDLSEKEPLECVDVNIVGSQNILRVSIDHKVDSLIGISTDKAAPPVGNIYGHSKAIMERMFCSMANKSKTKICCLRFGNIAWSTNSIFPEWKKMNLIESTGSEMRRFFFSIEDACKLVHRSLNNINKINGCILSQKMKSTKIKKILDIWSKKFNTNWIKTNKRPGDKIDEYLIGDLEIENCKIIKIDKIEHYLLKFNYKFKNHIKGSISTKNSDNLTNTEIIKLIDNEPQN